jgi:hypothetical protein
MNAVQYSWRVRNMKVLLGIHVLRYTPYRYCCRTYPNQDDLEGVIVVKVEGILYRMLFPGYILLLLSRSS